jgi:hypothetical protein
MPTIRTRTHSGVSIITIETDHGEGRRKFVTTQEAGVWKSPAEIAQNGNHRETFILPSRSLWNIQRACQEYCLTV